MGQIWGAARMVKNKVKKWEKGNKVHKWYMSMDGQGCLLCSAAAGEQWSKIVPPCSRHVNTAFMIRRTGVNELGYFPLLAVKKQGQMNWAIWYHRVDACCRPENIRILLNTFWHVLTLSVFSAIDVHNSARYSSLEFMLPGYGNLIYTWHSRHVLQW